MSRVGYKGIADATPPPTAEDSVHQLQIKSAKRKVPKSRTDGKETMTEVMIIIPSEPDVNPIYVYLNDPQPLDEFLEKFEGKWEEADWKRFQNLNALDIKKFCTAFGIPFDADGYDTDDFPGKVADIRTKSEKDDQGRINVSLVLPEVL